MVKMETGLCSPVNQYLDILSIERLTAKTLFNGGYLVKAPLMPPPFK